MAFRFFRSSRLQSADSSELEALEFARNVHDDMILSNRDLYTRAQWILTVDGVSISLIAGRMLASPKDLRPVTAEFTLVTWVLLSSAGLFLLWSVLSAVLAIRSAYRTGPQHAVGAKNLRPEQMWFFRHVAQIPREDFVREGARATRSWEITARLAQAAAMAPNMVKRARWLNRSILGAGLGYALFGCALADYVVSVQ